MCFAVILVCFGIFCCYFGLFQAVFCGLGCFGALYCFECVWQFAVSLVYFGCFLRFVYLSACCYFGGFWRAFAICVVLVVLAILLRFA